MRQAAHQVARGDLLGMLELFLAETPLIIHRGHLQQDQAVRQTLRRQGKNV